MKVIKDEKGDGGVCLDYVHYGECLRLVPKGSAVYIKTNLDEDGCITIVSLESGYAYVYGPNRQVEIVEATVHINEDC